MKKAYLLLLLSAFLFPSCNKSKPAYNNVDKNITKWVAIGNSITCHPINEDWWGEYGMAASKPENDFVHVLNEMLGGSFTIAWGVEWERNHPTYDLAYFDGFFDGDEDLVVIRLGENVTNMTNYEADFRLLVQHIKSLAPKAKIIITGVFMTGGAGHILCVLIECYILSI